MQSVATQLFKTWMALVHQPNHYVVVRFLRKPISSFTGEIDIYPVHSARRRLNNWGQKFWLHLIFLSLVNL